MNEPGPVSPDVVRRMREVITTAIANRSMTVLEASAEARGLGRGLQPALSAEAVARAVTELLRELGCYQASLAAPVSGGSDLRRAYEGRQSNR